MPVKLIVALFVVLVAASAAALLTRFEYAPVPQTSDLLNPARIEADVAYDLFGERISQAEAEQLLGTDAGRRRLSPANGAIRIDDELRRIGREAFYAQTFGNEWFMTDVMGSPTALSRHFRSARRS